MVPAFYIGVEKAKKPCRITAGKDESVVVMIPHSSVLQQIDFIRGVGSVRKIFFKPFKGGVRQTAQVIQTHGKKDGIVRKRKQNSGIFLGNYR